MNEAVAYAILDKFIRFGKIQWKSACGTFDVCLCICHRPHASVLLDERNCVEWGGVYYIACQRLIWVDSLFQAVRPLIIENINKCKLKKKTRQQLIASCLED